MSPNISTASIHPIACSILLRRKKNAPKGGGHKNFDDFERISWDGALDEVQRD